MKGQVKDWTMCKVQCSICNPQGSLYFR